MGIGAMIVRGAVITAAGGLLYAALLNPLMDRIGGSNAAVEQGYTNPKSLSIQGKKNAAGNIEAYLQYKNGDEVISLPCTKGPSGPLCGTVDHWWGSIGAGQREGLAVNEWPSISNSAKRGILDSELQAMLDSFYGTQKAPQQSQQQAPQYSGGKQK